MDLKVLDFGEVSSHYLLGPPFQGLDKSQLPKKPW